VAFPGQHETAPASPSRSGRESEVTLSVLLLLLLVTSVMSWPLRDAGMASLLAALRLATLVVGVAAIRGHRSFAIAASAVALAAFGAQLLAGDHAPSALVPRLVFYVIVAAALLARVFGPGRVTVHRLLGAVAVYVLLAIGWGTAFQLVVELHPGSIQSGVGPATPDDALWLSFITITTCGYGDILPKSGIARSLAALEAMVGVLYPAILISRLVSLVQGPSAADDGPRRRTQDGS
jgi:hypothetical protein